jgi:hypothetical protein
MVRLNDCQPDAVVESIGCGTEVLDGDAFPVIRDIELEVGIGGFGME